MSQDVMIRDRADSGVATLEPMNTEQHVPNRLVEQPLRRDRTARGVADDAPSAGPVAAPLSTTPPGWYLDPADRRGLRWWTGVIWTDHTTSAAPASVPDREHSRVEPAEAGRPASPTRSRPAPSVFTPLGPIRVHTLAVWLLAFAPLVLAAGEHAIARSLVGYGPMPVRIAGAGTLLALSLLFAFFDRSRLRDGWHSDTASPWWVLLTPFAYLTARTVRVRRETGVRATGMTLVWLLMLVPVVAIAFGWDGVGSDGIAPIVELLSGI